MLLGEILLNNSLIYWKSGIVNKKNFNFSHFILFDKKFIHSLYSVILLSSNVMFNSIFSDLKSYLNSLKISLKFSKLNQWKSIFEL
jgi:hypothetical protein